MSTLVLSLAGQALGGLVAGPFGAMAGRAIGALAGRALDEHLFGGASSTPGRDIQVQTSSEGGGLPRIYGWNRVTGNVIWATELERLDVAGSGAKAFGASEDGEAIAASFAIGLCEGPVAHVGRIWADGQLMDTRNVVWRFHAGDADQAPDPLIEAKQGVGNCPAYRGLCHIVFERLDLSPFGNRVPQIAVELCRPVGHLEQSIRAICVIPGATEHGYDPQVRVRVVGRGQTVNENAHQYAGRSDWDASLDELQALCPSLEHVALVVAWFGDDLRCGSATIRPKVIANDREVTGTQWRVSGLSRETAPEVTQHDGGPAYGGSPSDDSVLAAIADLKARGLKVTLYPFVMMDVPSDNDLPNPEGGTGQPAYPWRGRMTCHPAPGQPASPDQSAAAATQVADFLGDAQPEDFAEAGGEISFSGGADWGYRRFVLHYARLCAAAGGVDAFLIGSEMRGLTQVRSASETFPFVDGLVALAAEVREVLGADTQLTYAADWSEYSGYQPASEPGAKYFHLDALWADANIDAIGIDYYPPLSDWRDGEAHLDFAETDTPHDLTYLKDRLAGGEGFDWFYASEADRLAQTRTPVTDGAHDEPFVWRVKDLKGFWSQVHHNRPGGVRSATPTAWIPESKPIWLTEIGCGAVDKGANQPNAFADPKSAENLRPYFSNGSADGAIQRNVAMAAHLRFQPGASGFDAADNPASSAYAGTMLDPDRLYLWAWDARPFPAFPLQQDEWSDGPAWASGHWLNGRLGGQTADELIAAMLADASLSSETATSVPPLIDGAMSTGVRPVRQSIEPLAVATALVVRQDNGALILARRAAGEGVLIQAGDLAAEGDPLIERSHPDPTEKVSRLTLGYTGHLADYEIETAVAFAPDPGGAHAASALDLTLLPATAGGLSKQVLGARNGEVETLSLALPPSRLALEPGDRLATEDGARFEIVSVRDGASRAIEARRVHSGQSDALVADIRGIAAPDAVVSVPALFVARMPPPVADETSDRYIIAAYARPWPGYVEVRSAATSAVLARLDRPGYLGRLLTDLPAFDRPAWDMANTLEIVLDGGHASSTEPLRVLSGGNRVLVAKPDGSFEEIGFENADLVAPEQYALSGLLRGLGKTGPAARQTGLADAAVLLLGGGEAGFTLPAGHAGTEMSLRSFAGAPDLTGSEESFALAEGLALPLRPAHLLLDREAGGDISVSWVRRSRLNGDLWSGADVPADFVTEAYRVTILDGETPVRTIEVTSPLATYTLADQTADFGGPASGFHCSVAQLSATLGPGHPATTSFAD